MTSGEYDIHPAVTLPAPSATGEARPEAATPRAPEGEVTAASSAPKASQSLLKSWAGRVWRGRGLIGGLAAIVVAYMGQDALITQNDFATSTRNYAIAIAIIILSFLYPTWPSWFKRNKSVAGTQAATEGASATTVPDTQLPSGLVAELLPSDDPPAGVDNVLSSPLQIPDSYALPVRPARSRSNGSNGLPRNGIVGNGHSPQHTVEQVATESHTVVDNDVPAPAMHPKVGLWARYKAVRTALGWRVTAPGLALTFGLTAASALVLNDNTASPAGGWLWVAALVVLLVTFVGAAGWPRGEGLLPTPWSDFFGPGVPRIPWKVEAVLVLLVMGLATFLRLWNLEYHPGIFGDEGERGVDARGIFTGGTDNIFGYGWWGVPNMYFYALSLSFHIFGDNLTGDRMVSALSNLAAVWFVYRIGRLLWGPRAGIIAGLMMAVSPLALEFARLAGESTPTGALWAVGAYYLLLALRYRRWSDWVLSGFFWSFNLYFYASGKMVIPLAGVVALYALVRWRKEFFKQYFLGFALMGFAFALTFLPYGVASAKDNWQGFMGRANETSIFSPQNQAATFGRYGLPYDPTWAGKSLVENLRTNPVAWSGLVYQQVRETLDGVYRRGDQVPFYNVPGLVALAPLWAVLGMLGLMYALWKFWDARYAIIMLWFVVGMAASFLTIDTPNYQRFTNAWPAMMLFPAMLLDRVFAAGWPLSLSFARKWSALPVAAVLLFFAGDSYREYFVFFPTTCPYCTATVQARYVQALGQDYKGYQMGVGGYDNYFTYGSTRFVAKDVEGVDMIAAADNLPVTDSNDKGLAFIIYPNNVEYLPIIRAFYPVGVQEDIKGANDVTQFTSIKVTREQVVATRMLHATYRPASGSPIQQDEPHLGTVSGKALPIVLTFPAAAEWKGGLVAPQYGLYTFGLAATSQAALELDGRVVVEQKAGDATSSKPLTVQIVLAKGIHDVKLTGMLADAQTRIQVLWASSNTALNAIDAKYFFSGTTGGLSGQIGLLPAAGLAALQQPDPLSGQPATQLRSDPFIGFREASVLFQGSFVARWQGKLNVPAEGDYAFSLSSTAGGVVMIDGKSVYGNGPDGAATVGPVRLTTGPHDIEVRFASQGGPSRIELLWTRPATAPEIIPPTVLTPSQRGWTPEEAPAAPPASLPPSSSSAPVKQPDAVFGSGDLTKPRGIAVDKAGNIYVGDRGSSRVVVYTPDGKVARTWGKAAAQPKEGEPTPVVRGGEFGEILDVGVGPDGTVYVFDNSPRVQAFTSQGEFKGAIGPDQLGLYGPNGIDVAGKATDKNGIGVYIAVTGQGRIVHLPSVEAIKSGAAALPDSIESISIDQSTGDIIDQPVDVVVDPTGSGLVYAIDLKNRILQLKPPASAGAPWIIAQRWPVPVGRDDGGSRLSISPDGSKVYMTDPDRRRMAELNVATGEISFFGGEGNDPGKFRALSGVATGPDGRLYVVDSVLGRVQVFSPDKP